MQVTNKSTVPKSLLFFFITVVTLVFTATGCDLLGGNAEKTGGKNNNSTDNQSIEDWLISQEDIISILGKDGIPSIDNPDFSPINEIDYVSEERLVVGIKVGDEVRAYPHQILDWHEIVNDTIGDESIALTHCPLTGTAIGLVRELSTNVTEFGISGLLFKNNLILYDRNTESLWSQMQMRGIRGDHTGRSLQTLQVLETTWKTWKELYPESKVLTKDTGFFRPYDGFAYGSNYLVDDDNILFPIKNKDPRLNNKDRVHGIINEVARESATPRVYPLKEFGTGVNVVRDRIKSVEFIIVGSSDLNFVSAFQAAVEDGKRPDFKPVQDEFPVILKDEEGNRWDIFGYAVEGPRAGERLIPAKSYTGYWFAWVDIFPELDIYQFN